MPEVAGCPIHDDSSIVGMGGNEDAGGGRVARTPRETFSQPLR